MEAFIRANQAPDLDDMKRCDISYLNGGDGMDLFLSDWHVDERTSERGFFSHVVLSSSWSRVLPGGKGKWPRISLLFVVLFEIPNVRRSLV